jgi:hypothetical protein
VKTGMEKQVKKEVDEIKILKVLLTLTKLPGSSPLRLS